MERDIYIEIIKKQQELIDLMINAGIHNDVCLQSETPTINNITVENYNKTKNIECDLTGFEKHLIKKGRSKNCIDTYITGIKLFYKEYGKLNAETLEEYETHLHNDFKPQTINLRISGMQAYFDFIGFKGYEFRRAKEQKKTFCDNAINEQQYNQLMKYAAEHNRRVWLICKVISNTGVRVSELINLKTSYLEKGYADIIGKGSKQRRIYFPENLIKEIKDECGKEYIIENHNGKRISTRGVSGLLQKVGIAAGVPKEVLHPHSFRHFFAKQFLKNNNDITLLGDLLGHSDISTTAIYTRKTSEEQLRHINGVVNW